MTAAFRRLHQWQNLFIWDQNDWVPPYGQRSARERTSAGKRSAKSASDHPRDVGLLAHAQITRAKAEGYLLQCAEPVDKAALSLVVDDQLRGRQGAKPLHGYVIKLLLSTDVGIQ